ncbi:hypothetical protein [Halobellus rubicundus]|uniref:Uncharacterized protein n=1 Tax=Halobellus rubicundus TaxID=2996466 RepID=A0ABD5ME49_9EURY
MSRERSAIGRRRLLAISGTGALAALAGCSGFLSGESEPTVDADALAEAVSSDAPAVPETVPIDIEASFVDEQESIARSALDGVPAPFDREEIPNGVIRERLNGVYESATESIDRVDEALTPYDRLDRANGARVDAHEVQAAWRAIDTDLTVSELTAEAPAIAGSVDEVDARWSYVGDDPVRAVVVHDEIGTEIRAARNWLDSRHRRTAHDGGTALEVGALASDHERARTSVAVASYLFDRFRASLDASADLRPRFEAARATLRTRVLDRMESLPPRDVDEPTSLVDRDVGETAGVRALASLGSDARFRADSVADAESDEGPSPASDVLSLADVLVYVRAFASLRERIEDGDDIAVEGVEDVAAVRESAIDAVAEARDADRGALLVDAMLPGFASEIRWADDRMGRASGTVRVDSVAYDAIDYVVAGATCRALPPVCAEAATALRNGSS